MQKKLAFEGVSGGEEELIKLEREEDLVVVGVPLGVIGFLC